MRALPRQSLGSIAPPRTKLVIFGGGVNEEVANVEMLPGELLECMNFEEIDGEFHGYRSISGFERYDGITRSVEYPADSGEFIDAIFPSGVPIRFDGNGLAVDDPFTILTENGFTLQAEDSDTYITEGFRGDLERENTRDLITACPGIGDLLAVFEYNTVLYAIRGQEDGFTKLYALLPVTGYTEVVEYPADIPSGGFSARFTKGRLAEWPQAPGVPNTPILILCTAVSDALAIYRNTDTGEHIVEVIDDTSAGSDEIHLPLEESPTIPIIFDNRLMLVYPKGHLFFGNLGLLSFNPVTDFAGEFYFGSEITDIVATPGDTLMIWMERGIKILKPNLQADGESVVVGFKVETFSDVSGSIPRTAARFLGTMIYCDDRGVVLLDTADTFGDFKASSLSKRVYKTYLENRDNIIGAWVNREKNQYNVMFPGGAGISFTFDIEKKVKGAAFFGFKHSFTCSDYNLKDMDSSLVFGDSNGYVQIHRKAACSFDGIPIDCLLSTAYHNYGLLSIDKSFKKVLLEMTGQDGQRIQTKVDFDYGDLLSPVALSYAMEVTGSATNWGTQKWSEFIWGGAVVNQEHIYIHGFGTTCSLQLASFDAHRLPYTINNFTMFFSPRGQNF